MGNARSPATAWRRARVRAAAPASNGGLAVNVAAKQLAQNSFLHWIRRIIGARKTIPALSWGYAKVLPSGVDSVVAVRAVGRDSTLLTLHNLAPRPVKTRPLVDLVGSSDGSCSELFADVEYEPLRQHGVGLALSAYGYRWIRPLT